MQPDAPHEHYEPTPLSFGGLSSTFSDVHRGRVGHLNRRIFASVLTDALSP
jgi:hypothetical protein